MEVADMVLSVLSIISEINNLAEKVKANKKRCQRVSERVRFLEAMLKSIQGSAAEKNPAEVREALQDLSYTLRSAQALIEKYTTSNLVKRIVKSSSHGDEFSCVNDRLGEVVQSLALALQLQNRNDVCRMFELVSRQKQDEEDRKEDDAELKRSEEAAHQMVEMSNVLVEYAEYVEAMRQDLEAVKLDVHKVVETLNKPRIVNMDIRIIKIEELKYIPEFPKKPFMKTPTAEVYKGEFCGFSVAIKKYIDAPYTNPGKVKSVFDKEVETMKRFESPNILRMFGICILDEQTPKPQYLIIMEYCEKGSLRDVLSSKTELSWAKKASMCLDAAQGLYRLHLTEENSKVHGSINSNKFLVDENFRVKLGGFELSRTETSLKNTKKEDEKKGDIRSLCYMSPQLLNSIHQPYSKQCDIYSFGIVMWEIATRKKPFEDCSSDDKFFFEKVYEEKYQEPLPPDCPESLEELINKSRAFESFERPTAGVLVDKLRSVVVQLEKQ